MRSFQLFTLLLSLPLLLASTLQTTALPPHLHDPIHNKVVDQLPEVPSNPIEEPVLEQTKARGGSISSTPSSRSTVNVGNEKILACLVALAVFL